MIPGKLKTLPALKVTHRRIDIRLISSLKIVLGKKLEKDLRVGDKAAACTPTTATKVKTKTYMSMKKTGGVLSFRKMFKYWRILSMQGLDAGRKLVCLV